MVARLVDMYFSSAKIECWYQEAVPRVTQLRIAKRTLEGDSELILAVLGCDLVFAPIEPAGQAAASGPLEYRRAMRLVEIEEAGRRDSQAESEPNDASG